MLEYSISDKDNLNNSNNNISNIENDNPSQNSEDVLHPKITGSDEIPEFAFSVIKLGRRGFSHKTRILYINKDCISYYKMVEKNEKTKDFLDCLRSIYFVRTGDDIDIEKIKELARKFKNLPEEEKILKGFFTKYEISVSENVSSFKKAPITIRNDEERDFTNPTNFWVLETREKRFRDQIINAPRIINEAIKAINSKREDNFKYKFGKKYQKEDKLKELMKDEKLIVLNEYKDKIKYIGLLYQGFMKEYLKTICEYSHKKRNIYDKIGNQNRNDKDDNNEYMDKDDRDKFFVDNHNYMRIGGKSVHNRKNNDMNNRINESREDFIVDDIKDKNINNILEEKINDTIKLAYLELAIYYCYDLFVKYCEKVVEKIVYHLGTFDKAEDILKTGKLHPIVFPNPCNFTQITNNNPEKQDDNSEPVLLYSIWGVNYTLTWNNLTAKFGETVGTSGKWKKIKHQFQQKNYFQDLLIKLATVAETTDEFPNIPVSCIIDFNGFRVYCESDIFASEEYIEGMKLQINKSDMSFFKNIMELLSENNNEDIKKIEISNIYCKIKNEYIAEEKGFELKQYIKTMIEEFLKTFDNKNQGNSMIENSKKIDPFSDMQSQRPIINCIKKLITDDRNIMGITKEHFDDFQNESIEFQRKCTFQYLMYFDVLIPIENKYKKNDSVYYRQEIAINNINVKEELKQLAPKYLQKSEYFYKSQIENLSEDGLYKAESSGGNKKMEYNRNLRISTRNIQITKNKEDNDKKKYKSPEDIIIDILRKNTSQNNDKIRADLKKKFNQKFDNLLMAFDSLYLIPYNSETLKICFHYYGINLHYLGRMAERTSVPHIREICIIEMFARVCKKIIFDLLGQSTYERAMKAFYSNIKELTTKLHCVPVSLNVVYGTDYLKSITQPVERGKCYYKNMEITGLYMNSEEYPLS